MKKISIFLLLFALLFIHAADVNAATGPMGFRASFRIESATETLIYGAVNAYSLSQALEVMAAGRGLTLTYTQRGSESRLTGMEFRETGEDVNAGISGEWSAYVIRRGEVVRQDAFLDMPIENGDEAVVYFGVADETRIVTHFTCEATAEALTFFVGAETMEWAEDSGEWSPREYVLPIEDAFIHVDLPGGGQATGLTDSEGRAAVLNTKPGYARFYAEGYRQGRVPLIVRTLAQTALCGFDEGAEAVSRAETAAFLVNTLAEGNTKPARRVPAFSDVTERHPLYGEISAAASFGIVAGYEDNTFRPDEPVTLLQLCAMVSRIFPEVNKTAASYADESGGVETNVDHETADETETEAVSPIPEWALPATEGMTEAGWLENIGAGWNDLITPETLNQLYKNITE
ncbi:MAG: S-layer homology domain-containing protein [Clostridiales bacterium]|jgi:hypothetical protein|nr:S-layer homology domain-containing protein [Clostridiales bacterium]